jgi:hypothetical protein
MPEQTPWSRYIEATSGGALNTVIAAKVNVDPATLGRWRTGAVAPGPRQVVDYARAYGLSPIGALIAAGYLTAEEVGIEVTIPSSSLSDYSTGALAEEVASRFRETASPRRISNIPTTTDIGDDKPHVSIRSNNNHEPRSDE